MIEIDVGQHTFVSSEKGYKNKFLSIFYKWPKLYFGLNA